MGRFDYPSPYWDSVGDPALDLIDRMLTVDVNKRITIDECLEHPWTTAGVDGAMNPGASMESTDGLTGAMGNLDFSKRKPTRERTLLSSINDPTFSKVPATQNDDRTVRVWNKNKQGEATKQADVNGEAKEEGGRKDTGQEEKREKTPAHGRDPEEFVQMGGKGDQALFGDEMSRYPK